MDFNPKRRRSDGAAIAGAISVFRCQLTSSSICKNESTVKETKNPEILIGLENPNWWAYTGLKLLNFSITLINR